MPRHSQCVTNENVGPIPECNFISKNLYLVPNLNI